MNYATLIAAVASGALATTALSVPKQILIQEFTATWCPNCENTGDGVTQLLQDNPDTLVGMMLHVYDSYQTPLSSELLDFYGQPGQPLIWVDGYWTQVGSTGNGNANAASIGALVDQASTTTDVTIDVQGQTLSASDYELDVTVGVETGGAARSMRVYVTQVYSDTSWPEANEQQFNTQRQSAPTQHIVLQPGETWSYSHVFTLTGESLDVDNVNFIVWAQDDLASPPAMIRQVAMHGHGDVPPCDCVGDLDCSYNVNVDDLLTVIAGWNNPYNVDDLLEVISAWGPCE